jgi:hypothetical protein
VQLFASCLDSSLVFLNAHLAMRPGNQVAVFAYKPGTAALLYPPPAHDAAAAIAATVHLPAMNAAVRAGVQAHLHTPETGDFAPLGAALTKALCCT